MKTVTSREILLQKNANFTRDEIIKAQGELVRALEALSNIRYRDSVADAKLVGEALALVQWAKNSLVNLASSIGEQEPDWQEDVAEKHWEDV